MARGKPGLTEQDLADLRAQLADGKRPRVQLSGPHFPVETAGTVVRIGEPEVDGPDFVRVRVRVNNMTDELAFAPGELRLRGRDSGRPARPAAKTTRRAAVRGAAGDAAADGARDIASARNAAAARDAAAARATAPARDAAAARGTAPATGSSARRRKAIPASPVTVTIASAGPAWSLTATRGTKNLVKNVPLPPGVVTALAELLDQPPLSAAVGEINEVALAEAQARAEQLRAELDQLEAVLATHRAPRRR